MRVTNTLVWLMLLVAGTVIQTMLPGWALLGQAKMPVLPAIVVYCALTRDTPVVLAVGLLAGLLQDALSPVPLGYSAVGFCLAGWLTGLFRKIVMAESPVTQVFFGSVMNAGLTLMTWALLTHAGLLHYPPGRLVVRTMGAALLAAVWTPLVFAAGACMDRLLGHSEARDSIDEIEGFQY